MYAAPVNFDTIGSALEFIKTELQSNIDKNNARALEYSKAEKRLDLIQVQIDDMNMKAQDLIKYTSKLESKGETARQELRDHTAKVTERLEKERSEFEKVRAKYREEQDEREKKLDTWRAQLEQVELHLNARETALNEREKQLSQSADTLTEESKKLSVRGVELEKYHEELRKKLKSEQSLIQQTIEDVSKREQYVKSREDDLDYKAGLIRDKDAQSEKYRDETLNMMSMAENQVRKMEGIDKRQKDREERLNLKEATLLELDKSIARRKIQLDDRASTIKSY
jgi:hypothetical protein